MVIITPEDAAERLSPVFKGRVGKGLFHLAAGVTGIGRINALHDAMDRAGVPYGTPFARRILEEIGVDFRIGNADRLQSLPEGPFIIVANHVYGHIDGICLLDLFGQVRPRLKVMANEMLTWIPGLAPSLIAVNPATAASRGVSETSVHGVKNALLQLQEGEPLGLFPSGAVADLKPREGWTLRERDWQDAAVRFIRKARVPVVPVRFFDRNSCFYYALGLVDYRLRFLRLFHEMFNKRGSRPRLGIGPTIPVAEQDAHPDLQDFKAFLRDSVDSMPLPRAFTNRSEL